MATIIETVDIKKRYKMGKNNFVDALRGVSAQINAGEMVAIVGPSGSGKSTFMHMIGCLDKPDSGTIVIDGEKITGLDGKGLTRIRSRQLGFIFQQYNLIPTLSAIENVALASQYAGRSRKKSLDLAMLLLRQVRLDDRARHLPTELSGCQQQRVAIARSLINAPKVVLGDEPTGNLDTASSAEVVDMMKDICTQTGTAFVLVTHNPEISAHCHRVIRMKDGVIV
jgi:putative ABC transport system ATP-binding protein